MFVSSPEHPTSVAAPKTRNATRLLQIIPVGIAGPVPAKFQGIAAPPLESSREHHGRRLAVIGSNVDVIETIMVVRRSRSGKCGVLRGARRGGRGTPVAMISGMTRPALGVLAGVAVLLLAGPASANAAFPNEIVSRLGLTCRAPDCTLCHVSDFGQC